VIRQTEAIATRLITILLVLALMIQGSYSFAFAAGYTEASGSDIEEEDVDLRDVKGLVLDEDGRIVSIELEGLSDEEFKRAMDLYVRQEREEEANDNRHNYLMKDDESPDVSAEMSVTSKQDIRYKFLDTGGNANTWTFPYSDGLFELAPSYYSYTMAQASLGFAASTARSNPKVVPRQYKTYLTKAGFTNLYAFGYDKKTTENTLSGVIGMKQIGDFTVIAAATCGQGYKNEWAGNMKVGKGERHQGFEEASVKLEKHIAKYIDKYQINGKKKLWLTGISRAAAVANLTAADAIESGDYEDVYAYLFGVPRTTKAPKKYAGIYNICGQYDPVAAIPFETWGFERYGTDLYTPSQESDAGFNVLAYSAVDVGNELDGKGFRNNPEVNYQLRIILEWLGMFFDDADEYTDRFQPLLMKAMLRHDETELLETLVDAFRELHAENSKEKESIEIFVNYISYIIAQHTRASVRQEDDGSWDPTESLAANLVIEHRPSTYIRWLFSDALIEDPMSTSINSRRLTINGDVTVTAFLDGEGITRIDNKGRITAPDPNVDSKRSGERGVFMMRNGKETIVSLPADTEYYIEIDAEGEKYLSYFDVNVTPDKLVTQSGRYHMGLLKDGRIGIKVVPDEDLASTAEKLSGDYDSLGTSSLSYSPTVIMSDELEATKYSHLSLEGAYRLVCRLYLGVSVILFLCFLTWLVHRKGRKNGHGPYSVWYVIIPHLIFIFGFASLTQYFTYFLYTVKSARVVTATITMAFIALLAIRGAMRSKRVNNLAIAVVLIMFVPIVYVYYENSVLSKYSYIHVALFYLIVIMLTLLAGQTFRGPETHKVKLKGAVDKADAPEDATDDKDEEAPEEDSEEVAEEATK
jgi:uncharacterized membrane protein YhaH (DUF805 family)